MSEMLLKMNAIDKSFPGVRALKNCEFELKKGEIHSLVGENGAGKSTLMKILTGIYKADAGTIYLENEAVSLKSPRDAQNLGISMVHQELNLMHHLTVAQNIFIGRESEGLFTNDKSINARALALFKKLNIKLNPEEKVGNLSVSHQQMIEIAKAISFNAKIIIFDEPTASLTNVEIDELFEIMNELKKTGVGMVYISHRMDEIKRISDRVTVMRDGEHIGTRDAKTVQIDDIIHMMVGRISYEKHTKKSGIENMPVVLKVEDFASRDVKGVSFELHKGEILGFAGLMGAGRTELARLIFGADKKTSGRVYLDGKEIHIRNPFEAVNHGICYLSEDRKRYGLALGLSISDNVILPALEDYVSAGIVNEKKIAVSVKNYIGQIDIKTPSHRQLVKNLSGGNQQKVIIAKWLLKNCNILIFDEPTRGIDVGAKSEIYKIINMLAAEGKSIIMISSEMPELIRMSDRILVMCEGVHTGTLNAEEIDQNRIMKYATQH